MANSTCPHCSKELPLMRESVFCQHCGMNTSYVPSLSDSMERFSAEGREPTEDDPNANTLALLIGLPLGFLVHFLLLVFLSFNVRPQTAIFRAVILCVVSIAVAIPALKSPSNQGAGFGILIGVALTALLTAQCALTGPSA